MKHDGLGILSMVWSIIVSTQSNDFGINFFNYLYFVFAFFYICKAMVERGPDVSSSEFCIWMTRDPWFDGKYVVFGRVVEGNVVLKKIVVSGDSDGNPTNTVTIVDCNVYDDTISRIEMPHTPFDPFFVP